MTKRESHSLKETELAAQDFLNEIEAEAGQATLVCLQGDLGSGKTTFTQALARRLGVSERITSPTFVIQKTYPIKSPKAGDHEASHFRKLVHIDAYRLNRGEELLLLGWEEIAGDPANLILLEWPEKVRSVLPETRKEIFFRFVDEVTREISW